MITEFYPEDLEKMSVTELKELLSELDYYTTLTEAELRYRRESEALEHMEDNGG